MRLQHRGSATPGQARGGGAKPGSQALDPWYRYCRRVDAAWLADFWRVKKIAWNKHCLARFRSGCRTGNGQLQRDGDHTVRAAPRRGCFTHRKSDARQRSGQMGSGSWLTDLDRPHTRQLTLGAVRRLQTQVRGQQPAHKHLGQVAARGTRDNLSPALRVA